MSARLPSGSGSSDQLAERVLAILESKKLTLYQASRRSAALFGRSSPYYVPHNLYYELRRGALTPSLYQLFALSRVSGYRLRDWLRVFGFDIDQIPRLQLQIHGKRTILLDSSIEDPATMVPGLKNTGRTHSGAAVIPLAQIFEWTTPRRLDSLADIKERGFLYARIGYEDNLAFPELLAGSIVRVNPKLTPDNLPKTNGEVSRHLFLIEHRKGLCCCRIQVTGKGLIALVSAQLSSLQVEFRVPEDARLVGVVDLEIRSLVKPQPPRIPNDAGSRWKAERLTPKPSQLGQLLRWARLRMGLSFRAASRMSREVAALLRYERYFIAPGSLSDYETINTPPRHFHKIMTFCAVYALSFSTVLDSLGLPIDETGHDRMPDALLGQPSVATIDSPDELQAASEEGFLRKAVAEFEEIPFFLRGSLKALSGLARPSLKDFFWVGGIAGTFHPYLGGGLLAVVNRQQKKPNGCERKPLWRQPLYIVLKRDGTYVCGCSSRENNKLIVHSYPGGVHRSEQFRNRDAEIIGKIVVVVRKLT
jgi:transcriptional regulator with XRE-family HTH domain